MKLKNSISVLIFILTGFFCFAQMDTYTKKIELNGVTHQWHKIILPTETFQTLKADVSDIRIYGITATDTIEAPYVLQLSKAIDANTSIPFNLINSVRNSNSYFYTYELPSIETINKIKLNFKNANFNWLISLEASQDQQKWFSILDDYRILSVVNDQTNYSFTDLKFTNSKYKFYRIKINSTQPPILNAVTVLKQAKKEPEYRSYGIRKFTTKQEKKNTIIDIDLNNRVAISLLELNIDTTYDYYRPVSIQYLADSIKTEKGYHYNYRTLAKRTLSSLEETKVQLPSTLTKKLRVIISNFDNQPLKISSAKAKGYLHTLTARFTEPASYYLVYGKTTAQYPIYDISQTKNSIPTEISELTYGSVQHITKKEDQVSRPLFENKLWLWILLAVIILGLGYFTIQMMRKKI